MVEVVVYPGPCCRIRLRCPAGGAVVTVATPRCDGYHRRVVTSGRLAARERGQRPASVRREMERFMEFSDEISTSVPLGTRVR